MSAGTQEEVGDSGEENDIDNRNVQLDELGESGAEENVDVDSQGAVLSPGSPFSKSSVSQEWNSELDGKFELNICFVCHVF